MTSASHGAGAPAPAEGSKIDPWESVEGSISAHCEAG
jgi:hypothetical protein